MKKQSGVLLILLIAVIIVFAVVFFSEKKTSSPVETGSYAQTEETVSSGETIPDDESGSEQVDEYIVELDEDETFEIN